MSSKQYKFSTRKIKKHHLLLCGVLLFTLAVNVSNNTFSLDYHFDEYKKCVFVKLGTHDFHHPMLMIQFAKAANAMFRFDELDQIVVLGRTLNALYGMLTVLFVYLISRRSLSKIWSLIVALGVGISPIMVIHTHYFKEDMLFGLFAIAFLWALFRYVEKPHVKNALWLGIFTGLALSTQYKGVALIALYLMAPFCVKKCEKGAYFKKMPLVIGVSALIFVISNELLFGRYENFVGGLLLQVFHVLNIHQGVGIPVRDTFFAYSLKNGLLPGMTLIITVLSIGFMVWALAHWKKVSWVDRILIVYAGLIYVATEISAMKMYSDHMRYMIPIAPYLIYFAYKGVSECRRFVKPLFLTILAALTFIHPVLHTAKLVHYIDKDTRKILESQVPRENSLYGTYTFGRPHEKPELQFGIFISYDDIVQRVKESPDIRYVVVSSMSYGRYYDAMKYPNVPSLTRDCHAEYEMLFNLPYREIKPAYMSYAFSNPTIRIVDVSSLRKQV